MTTTPATGPHNKPHTERALRAWATENRRLAESVALATAFAAVERERVDAYVRPIFVRYEFKDEDNGAPLTDPDRAFLAGADPRFPEYYAECSRAHREHGWKGDPEYCPALVAEELQRVAERSLLDSWAVFAGIADADGECPFVSLEWRAKVLDLALSTCLSDLGGPPSNTDEILARVGVTPPDGAPAPRTAQVAP